MLKRLLYITITVLFATTIAKSQCPGTNLNPGAHNTTPLTECIGYNPAPIIFTTPPSGGIPPYSYQWQQNGNPIGGETSSSFDPPQLTKAGTYTYNVLVTDACGTSTSTVIKSITIVPDPSVTISGGGNVCQNSIITLTSTVTNGVFTTYEWQSAPSSTGPWSAIPAATASTYSPPTSVIGITYYRLRIPNTASCNQAFSSDQAVTVVAPPSIFTVTGGGDYCAGGSGVVVGLNGSETNVSYQLQLNGANVGVPVPGTGNTLNFGLQKAAGTYDVVATSSSCTATMAAVVTVAIDPLPKVSVSSLTICTDGVATMTANPANGTSPYYYSWSVPALAVHPGNVASFNPTIAGTYSVVVIDNNGCNSTPAVATLSFYPSPTAYNITGGGTYCTATNGLPIGLNGSDVNATYQLKRNGVNVGSPVAGTGAPINFGLQTLPGVYTAIATSNATSCWLIMLGSKTVTVTTATNTTFNSIQLACQYSVAPSLPTTSIEGTKGNWSPAAINTTVAGVATYTFTPLAGQCAMTATITVTVLPAPTATISAPSVICAGTSANILFSGTPNATVTYNINGGANQSTVIGAAGTTSITTILSAKTVYNLIAVANASCSQSLIQSATINVSNISETTSLQPIPCNATMGGITISAVNGITPYSYSINGGSSYQTSNVFTGVIAGNYPVMVKDAAGCIANSNVTLAPTNSKLTESVTAPIVPCYETTGSISVSAANGFAPYTFSIDGGTNFQSSNIFKNVLPGNYTVMVKDALNCTTTSSSQVAIQKGFSLQVTANPDPVVSGKPVQLYTTAAQSYEAYQWTPANLFSNNFSNSQTIVTDTTVKVTVMARSTMGCLDTASVTVVVIPLDDVYVPSAFTPNGDGKNDVFRVYSSHVAEMEFQIFNRWGQMVFETKDKGKGWDGTFSGKSEPVDTYVYVVIAKKYDGTVVKKKGTVTLIR